MNFQAVLDPEVLTSQLSALTSLQSLDLYTSYFDENVLLSDAPTATSNGYANGNTATSAAEGDSMHYNG